MLSVRSKNMTEYALRLLFVVLLVLAAYCAVVIAKGADGKDTFDFSKPECKRAVLVVCLVVGAAVVVMLPTSSAKPASKSKVAKSGEAPEPVKQPEAVAASDPVEQSKPIVQPAPVEQSEPVERPEPVVPSEPVECPRRVLSRPQAPSLRNILFAARAKRMAARSSVDVPPAGDMVERMWQSARKIRHNYVPDIRHDGRYLNLLHGAAIAGHPKAQAKLGIYAFRRGSLVEAYYWMRLAKLNGSEEVEESLRDCRDQWKRKDCPSEHKNVYALFTERQGSLGRALLRLDCGVQSGRGLKRIRSMAAEGEAMAVRILGELAKKGGV